MLSGTHFYHATIKRIVSVFGTLFNNITVGRHSGNKISNIQRVPISYGPRQKFISRMNQDLDGQKVAIKLPRMSFEITSIDYDTSTKLNRLNTTLTSTSSNSPNKRNKMYQSVPYTIGMQLNVLARNQEDALQIVEQIIPTFSPEYTVTIKDIEGPGSKTDVPFILNGVTFSDDYEGDYLGRRTLTYTLDFTIRARFAPNTSGVSIIKKVETDLADFTNVATSSAKPMSRIKVSQDSPSAAVRTFVTLIDPADVHTVDLVYKDVSVSGIQPLNSITGITIASGATADFDRIEDEDFGSTLVGLSGQPSRFATALNNNSPTSDTPATALVGDGNVGTFEVGMTVSGGTVDSESSIITVATVTDQNNLVLSNPIVPLANNTALSFFFGSGATFSSSINGLTGATTGVLIDNIGKGYQATETITISTAPYNNTNLVLTVDSIFDGTGAEPAGAINTFSITSGNGANTDFTNTYTKTTTKIGVPATTITSATEESAEENLSAGVVGSGATFDLTIDKTGAITSATINQGGFDYTTSDQVKIDAVSIGETAKTFLLEGLTGTGGTGTNASFTFTLNGQDGSITDLQIIDAGTGYSLNDNITIAAANIGADSPGQSGNTTDLVIKVDSINQSPNQVNDDGTPVLGDSGIITGVSFVSGNTADANRVDAPEFEFDDTYTDLILNVTSVDNTVISGTFTKSGSVNNRPKYVHSTSSGVEMIYTGEQWELKQGNNVVAFNNSDSPAINLPLTNWNTLTRATDILDISTNDNKNFTVGENVVGNVSLGSGTVVTSNNDILTLNNLDAAYTDGEQLTGDTSGIIRVVQKTTLAI
jgi:hypothetical protein